MNEIIKLNLQTTDSGNKGILASELYKNLGGRPSNYSRWVDRNIVQNQYLEKNKDFIEITKAQISAESSDGRIEKSATFDNKNFYDRKDYILSLDTAKKISLSTKSPKQSQIVDAITKFMNVATKEPMIPMSKIQDMVGKMVLEAMAKQTGRIGNYETLMIENAQKDKTIESLQLQQKTKSNAADAQGAIRQIVNIIARETPYYAGRKDAHQVIYNMVISKFFKRSPVKWKADWYALKDKEYAKEEFARIKEEYGEKPASKLDWIRILHPSALVEIENCARDVAVNNLPYTYFQNGGTLPA